MTDLHEKIIALNNLVLHGETVKAMEQFYAETVLMQENEDPPRIGKKANIEREKKNIQNVRSLQYKLLNQAIDAAKEVVFTEWEIILEYGDGKKYSLKEVSIQHWQD